MMSPNLQRVFFRQRFNTSFLAANDELTVRSSSFSSNNSLAVGALDSMTILLGLLTTRDGNKIDTDRILATAKWWQNYSSPNRAWDGREFEITNTHKCEWDANRTPIWKPTGLRLCSVSVPECVCVHVWLRSKCWDCASQMVQCKHISGLACG